MNNLRSDISDLFAELDGYDRYETVLDDWSAWAASHAIQYRREYYREVYKPRYHSDRDVRARHLDAMDRYRDRVLGPDRPRRRRLGSYGPKRIEHGTYHAYTRHKCKCGECRKASATYQRSYRAAKRKAA